ncbi:MAG: hypothetical protein AB7O62_00250 [Pirellulales bacterium]
MRRKMGGGRGDDPQLDLFDGRRRQRVPETRRLPAKSRFAVVPIGPGDFLRLGEITIQVLRVVSDPPHQLSLTIQAPEGVAISLVAEDSARHRRTIFRRREA